MFVYFLLSLIFPYLCTYHGMQCDIMDRTLAWYWKAMFCIWALTLTGSVTLDNLPNTTDSLLLNFKTDCSGSEMRCKWLVLRAPLPGYTAPDWKKISQIHQGELTWTKEILSLQLSKPSNSLGRVGEGNSPAQGHHVELFCLGLTETSR